MSRSATPSPTTAPPPPAAARLQALHPRGLVRPLSGRCRRLRKAARQPRQAAPERRQLSLRTRNLRGARLRLPLRLPRPAAPGDHPGTPHARIRPRPDRDRAERRLSRAQDRRRTIELHNPADCPTPCTSTTSRSRGSSATIMVPDDYLGAVLTLCNERRGQQADLTYVGNRAMAVYRLPLNEVVFDFYDRLKSVTRGYASFDYQMDGYSEGDLVRISILVNNDPVDALSFIAHRSAVEKRGRAICEKLKDLIPAPALQDRHPGGDRRPHHRARNDRRAVEGRHGEVLWRRHHPQAQASREAEGRQEAHAPVRQGGNSAVRLPRRAEDGRVAPAPHAPLVAPGRRGALPPRPPPKAEPLESITSAV